MGFAYRFFKTRRVIDFGPNGDSHQYLKYKNVPQSIGIVISSRMANLHDLQSIYGMEDVYDMLEVLNVDSHNQEVANKA